MPVLASQRFGPLVPVPRAILCICLLAMGYYIIDHLEKRPADRSTPAADKEALQAQLEHGNAQARREALLALVAAGAEPELTRSLASDDAKLVQLAVAGLWECWLNEAGPAARKQMEDGIQAMSNDDLGQAARVFSHLTVAYPGWAEAINKQATVLYLQGRFEESIARCQEVVALKPDHFGAWNGMALCAVQVENWGLALQATHESLRLQPKSSANLQLLRLIESRLPQV